MHGAFRNHRLLRNLLLRQMYNSNGLLRESGYAVGKVLLIMGSRAAVWRRRLTSRRCGHVRGRCSSISSFQDVHFIALRRRARRFEKGLNRQQSRRTFRDCRGSQCTDFYDAPLGCVPFSGHNRFARGVIPSFFPDIEALTRSLPRGAYCACSVCAMLRRILSW